jgi:hypothetical protein
MHKLRFLSALSGLSLLVVSTAAASIFPDVPDGHMFQNPIERLVGSSVVNGNPDGNFYPNVGVNRAEMLKMLYKAAGKTPDPSSVRCFPDVLPGSWYEMFVCDAAANGYVNGYPDGTFRPAQEVNRVEALKMIMNILKIDVEEIDSDTREAVKFVDVSVSAWYTKYLFAAYEKGVLPIAGMNNTRFGPESVLLRGEAAAMIFNAINVELNEARKQSSSATSSKESDASASDINENSAAVSSSISSEKQSNVPLSYPFDTSGKFNEKDPYSYEFFLSATTTMFIEVVAQTGTLTCRLFLMKDSGFSEEYYLGHQEGSKCYLHTAVPAGNYQLQLQPSVENATFTAKASTKSGDGNDGFMQAGRLYMSVPKSGVLDVNDIQDYYTFVVTEEKNYTLETTNAAEVRCIVFSMSDVDLFGFSGPECNQSYRYPTGTYYVALSRTVASKTSKKTYSITLR